jgi:3-hydroxy acid dehydrogenase / malonic semialdehyde reductase
MTLAGKRILLTGGTTGIGRAMLHRFVREGARVLTMGRDEAAVNDALAHCPEGGEAHALVADVAKREDIARIFDMVDETLGGLDIYVSNAALGAGPLDEAEDEEWRNVIEVNLVGALAGARGALKRMDDGGQIIIIGSISAVIHAKGESVYSTTKAGLSAFAETLRKEVEERGIRVGLVEPGSVGSDMQNSTSEEQREKIVRHEMLCADDIADAVTYMLTRPPRTDIVTLRIEPRLQEL